MGAPALALFSEIGLRILIWSKRMSESIVMLHKVQSLPVSDIRSDIDTWNVERVRISQAAEM